MKKFLVLLMVLAISMFGVSAAFAYDVKVDEDTYAKFGTKMQIWVQSLQDAAPNTTDNALNTAIKQGRIYFAGQVTNMVKFGVNYDFARGLTDQQLSTTASAANTSTAGVTDGFITLDIAKEFKIMTGIYRMAVSRIALQDTYTLLLPHTPQVAAGAYLSNLNNYRNAGITFWGDLMDGMVRYNVGIWDGSNLPNNAVVTTSQVGPIAGGTNPKDTTAKSARVVVNFMDPEKGYTNSCCYLGKAKIANIGFGYLMQDYNEAVTLDKKTYSMATIDAYFEANNLTVEAAYFQYNPKTGLKPKGMYVQAGYQIGQIQPAVRLESYDADNPVAGVGDYKRMVLGVNYLIKGHDAKISLEYLKHDTKTVSAADAIDRTGPGTSRDYADVTLALQVQF
jgi:hypothetical protein